MPDNILYRGSAEFKGSARELAKFKQDHRFVTDPDWPHIVRPPGRRPSLIRVDIFERITKQYAAGLRRIKVGPIPGGIRSFHLHVSKEEIVLISRATFKKFVGDVAREVAMNLAAKGDYVDTMDAIGSMKMQ